MWIQSLGQEYSLEKEMATHFNIFAWRIQWTEEPGGIAKSRTSDLATQQQQLLALTAAA